MDALLDSLAKLVAFDTQNPPRALRADQPLFRWLREQLPGFQVTLSDHGEGCVSFLAVRGQPRCLVNIHLDTVPANKRWEQDPLKLVVQQDRAIGLGACDIKGSIAAALRAANQTRGPVALLFTTDEEYGESRCLHTFLKAPPAFMADVELVVVSEPTRSQAVLAHRGFARATARFAARPGHSSDPRGLRESAVHQLGRWLHAATEHAATLDDEGMDALRGLRFNAGRVQGGVADNIIASSASAVFSLRPPPGTDPRAAATALLALSGAPESERGEVTFVGPALPASDAAAQVARARSFALALGVQEGAPVDFWTEAALFSAAGYCTFVCGPGDIAQAHTAGEWVRLSELERARAFFIRLIDGAGSAP